MKKDQVKEYQNILSKCMPVLTNDQMNGTYQYHLTCLYSFEGDWLVLVLSLPGVGQGGIHKKLELCRAIQVQHLFEYEKILSYPK